MNIAFVIPAYNEERLLAGALAAIREASAPFDRRGWVTERIVCDNNSTDRTAEIARAAGARVVHEPVNQIARARNTGAAAALDADWLVFVDADSYPSPALVEAVAVTMESGQVLAGGAIVRFDEPGRTLALAVGCWNSLSRSLRWMAGSFIYCRADVFRAIGGFNQALYASEELDLSQRLKREARQRGLRIVIHHRTPLLTSARKARLYTPWEFLRFTARVVFTAGRPLRDRSACPIWYDGRR